MDKKYVNKNLNLNLNLKKYIYINNNIYVRVNKNTKKKIVAFIMHNESSKKIPFMYWTQTD